MIFAVRRKNENNEQVMHRFKKQIQSSGVVTKVRKSKFFSKKKTKRRIRDEAVKRTEYREKNRKKILWS